MYTIADRLRLVNGTNLFEGRVEVFHDGVWGTVCDNSWDANDARAVCTDLGFPYDEAQAKTGAFFGPGSGPIWLDNVACTERVSRLYNCGHRGWGVEDCSHGDDAGVICTDGR